MTTQEVIDFIKGLKKGSVVRVIYKEDVGGKRNSPFNAAAKKAGYKLNKVVNCTARVNIDYDNIDYVQKDRAAKDADSDYQKRNYTSNEKWIDDAENIMKHNDKWNTDSLFIYPFDGSVYKTCYTICYPDGTVEVTDYLTDAIEEILFQPAQTRKGKKEKAAQKAAERAEKIAQGLEVPEAKKYTATQRILVENILKIEQADKNIQVPDLHDQIAHTNFRESYEDASLPEGWDKYYDVCDMTIEEIEDEYGYGPGEMLWSEASSVVNCYGDEFKHVAWIQAKPEFDDDLGYLGGIQELVEDSGDYGILTSIGQPNDTARCYLHSIEDVEQELNGLSYDEIYDELSTSEDDDDYIDDEFDGFSVGDLEEIEKGSLD